MKGFLKIGIFISAILFPIIPLLFYLQGNWDILFSAEIVSMVPGVLSFSYLSIVLILSSRVPFLDRMFGQDKVMRFHGYMAVVAAFFTWLHHVLKEDVFNSEEGIHMILGNLAWDIIMYMTLITVLIMVPNLLHRITFFNRIRLFVNRKLKIGYSFLKGLHNILALAIIFMSIHVIFAQSTQSNLMRLSITILISTIGISSYIYHKFLRLLVLQKNKLTIIKTEQLNPDIIRIDMQGHKDRKFNFKPGQFGFFSFPCHSFCFNEHPFTISSTPANQLSITVKNMGDFTKKLLSIQSNTSVLYDGPYGVFSPSSESGQKLFIAGGIGITPFYSSLQFLDEHNKMDDVTLIWACKHKEDLVFHEYFTDLMGRCINFNTFHYYLAKKIGLGKMAILHSNG